jgi:D-beta-D-heptose 7-phosphate kinase/D-beta-D-heptose 1-phosphate adenosyltransferase
MTSVREAGRLEALVREFARKRILVIGDLMLDEYIWGKVARVSPEAPVPVVDVTWESYYPGGAANVARNVREFTPHTMMLGRVGGDRYGDHLLELLAGCGIGAAGVQRDAAATTTVKTRVIARNQQVVRVDRESRTPLGRAGEDEALSFLAGAIAGVDAVIVADYGKGFLTQRFAEGVVEISRTAGCILSVDPHPYTSIDWRGATAIKPNRLEAFLAAGLVPADPIAPVLADEALMEAGRRLMERWQPRDLLITLGEHGMLLLGGAAGPSHIPTCARTVFDVSGAGDTAIAVFTLALASGATALEAARLANLASGIVVGKLGTAAITPSELTPALAAAIAPV